MNNAISRANGLSSNVAETLKPYNDRIHSASQSSGLNLSEYESFTNSGFFLTFIIDIPTLRETCKLRPPLVPVKCGLYRHNLSVTMAWILMKHMMVEVLELRFG